MIRNWEIWALDLSTWSQHKKLNNNQVINKVVDWIYSDLLSIENQWLFVWSLQHLEELLILKWYKLWEMIETNETGLYKINFQSPTWIVNHIYIRSEELDWVYKIFLVGKEREEEITVLKSEDLYMEITWKDPLRTEKNERKYKYFHPWFWWKNNHVTNTSNWYTQ